MSYECADGHKTNLIRSVMRLSDGIRAVYLVDGTKINLVCDKYNRPFINIQKTPTACED